MRSGRAPAALAAVVPKDQATLLAREYARLLLCDELCACGACAPCMAWREDGHPDLVLAGPGDRAAKMNDASRRVREIDAFQADVALRPVLAKRRVGYVPFADELSLAASNALLKTIEEPPDGVFVILTASRDTLLPTIKSRSWNVAIGSDERSAPAAPPSTPVEWATWIAETSEGIKKKKLTIQDIYDDASAWSEHLASSGSVRKAADIKNIVYLAKERHISSSMLQDALHFVIKEGIAVERLFGDLREA